MLKKIILAIFNFYDQVIFGTEYTILKNTMEIIPKDELDIVLWVANAMLTSITLIAIAVLVCWLGVYVYDKLEGKRK